MFSIYLTPASVSYLTQFIMALAITVFLLNRLRSQHSLSLFLLTAFFAPITTLIGLLVLDAALLPYPRILPAYAENTVLALALVAVNGFAYNFPKRYPQHKWEMRVILAISVAFLFWEVGFMFYRYISLFTQGNVFNRFPLAAYSMPVVMLFAPVAFLRQTLAADPRRVAWWRKLWQPEGKDANGARNFALVFCIPFALGLVSVLINFGLPFTLFNAALSIGILAALWSFANNYVNFIPGSVNLASRLSILMLALFLALIGTLGWLISPSYIATFQPDLQDHQTLRFTPNAAGGYDVREVDFHFEPSLGEKVDAQTLDGNVKHRVAFTFPFYGETYTEIYAHQSGIISLGETFSTLNLQADVTRNPILFPLMISLFPDPAEQDSGLYINGEPERLIVTWNRLLASAQPGMRYTFQSILYSDGSFEFTYNGLPPPLLFSPDASAPANPWLRGVVAGRGEPLHELPAGVEAPTDLLTLARMNANPLLENHQLAFRVYLHAFMLPVAWVVVGGSFFILLIIPLLLRSSIAKPLEALTNGVRRMEAGELQVVIPVQTQDEIGFLTGAFNMMSSALDDQVRDLEVRVADRTRELNNANASMRALLENVKDVFARYDLNLRYQYISSTIQRLLGAPSESFIGKTHLEAGFPEDKADFFDASLRRVIETKTPIDVEFSLQVRGSETIQQTRVYPELNERLEVTSVVTVTSDITERKQAEAALRASEERFRSLIVSAPDAVFVVGTDGKIIFANVEASRLLGYLPDEFTGMVVENLLAENAREAHIVNRAKYMKEPRARLMGTQTDLIVLDKHGNEIPVDIKLSPLQTESGMQVVAFMRDISELKQAQNELKRSQEMYQDMVERQGVGVYRIRVQKYQPWGEPEQSHYAYEFVNDEYCRLTGASREEHFADPSLTLKLIHPADFPSFAKKNEEVDLTNEPFVWDGRMIIHGEVRWMHYESRPRTFPDTGTVWTGILMDITARKQADESALRMTERWSSAYQAAAEMRASLQTEQVYSAIHRAVEGIMPCPNFIIWLRDTLLVQPVGSYAFENGQRIKPSPYRADYGLGNWVVQHHQSLLLNGSEEIAARGIPCELRENAPVALSVLAVPMWVQGEIIGILSVQSYQLDVYSYDDMQLLEMLAGHLAIAIENARLYEEVRRLALKDQMTGVFNRTFFEAELARMELGRDFPASVIVADLDNLKIINDAFGHAMGDALIKSAAQTLQDGLRAAEIIARIGGDEFAVLLPHTDEVAVQEVLTRIRDKVQQQNDAYPDLPVQLSIGAATAGQGSLIMDAFMLADQAMYADKARRKGTAAGQ